MRNKTSDTLNINGILAIVIGVLIEGGMLTVGLMEALYAADVNKSFVPLLFLFFAILAGLVALIGGIGVLRRKSWARIGLLSFWMLIFASLVVGLFLSIGKDLSESYSDTPSAVMGFIFLIGLIALCGYQVFFFKRADVKVLFTDQNA